MGKPLLILVEISLEFAPVDSVQVGHFARAELVVKHLEEAWKCRAKLVAHFLSCPNEEAERMPGKPFSKVSNFFSTDIDVSSSVGTQWRSIA